MISKFIKASDRPTRLKMLVYGESGSGKTITALSMPTPAVIDTERGTDWYNDKFDFLSVQSADPDEITEALKEIIENPEGFKSLIIDSFSVLQEAIEERYLNKKRTEKNNPNYIFTPLDYKFIKNKVKSIIHALLAVDLNIVCTAKSKPVYDTTSSDFIGQIIGYQPEVRKEVPYLFDVVLELKVTDDGTRVANVHKDRTNKLPKNIDNFDYQALVKYFGIKDLEREPIKFKTDIEIAKRRNRSTEINFNGKPMLTAGVSSKTLDILLKIIKSKNIQVKELEYKLLADYGQSGLADLREDEALLLFKDLNGELDQV